MRTRTVLPAALAALALLSAPMARAQDPAQSRRTGPDPDTRRFLQTFIYDAAVVENLWIEGQFRMQNDATPVLAGDGADTVSLAPIVAWSPIDQLEVGGTIGVADIDFDGGGSESGFTDTNLYGKWQFFHNPVQFAAGVELSLPTGNEDDLLGTGNFDFAVFGSVRKNLEEAYLTGYFGFRSNGDVDRVGPDLDGKTSIFLGGGVMFPMSDRWALSGELQVETERYEQADSIVEITGGAYWFMTRTATLRGGIGLGLDDGAPDWELILGVAWTF